MQTKEFQEETKRVLIEQRIKAEEEKLQKRRSLIDTYKNLDDMLEQLRSPQKSSIDLKLVISYYGMHDKDNYNVGSAFGEDIVHDLTAAIISQAEHRRNVLLAEIIGANTLEPAQSAKASDQNDDNPDDQGNQDIPEKPDETKLVDAEFEGDYEKAVNAKVGDTVKCPNCGRGFTKRAANQIFCSRQCGKEYRAKHKEGGEA